MQKYSTVIQDTQGNAIPNATLIMYVAGTSTPGSFFSDAAGTSPITFPIRSDSKGYVECYGQDGFYDVEVGGTNLTTRRFYNEALLDDPSLGNIAGTDSSGALVTATGSTAARRLDSIASDVINAKHFGCVGDGLVNDTTAMQAFITYCRANNKHGYIPAGTYSCDALTIPYIANSHNIRIYGADAGTTIISKRTADGAILLAINTGGASYMSDIEVSGISLIGIAGNTPSVIYLESIVRSTFRDLIVSGGIIGIRFAGGISNTVSNSIVSGNASGIQVKRLSTAYLGGWPNNNDILNCAIVNNTTVGIDFDDGRLLSIDGCDIENNGTNGDLTTAGIRVGSNIGAESALVSPGLTLRASWFESNSGQAAIMIASGKTYIEQCYFVANANATNDIYISGGKYTLLNNDHDTNKVLCLNETAGVSSPNYVINCDFNSSNFDYTKTVQMNNRAIIGDVYLGNYANSEGLRVVNISNAVNRLQCYGNSTGNAPVIQSIGSDASVSLVISSYGASGVIDFYTNNVGQRQFRVSHTASAVNFVNVTGSPTGSELNVSAQGSDTNIDLRLSPKGSGLIKIGTASTAATTPAAFTADRYLALKDSTGATVYVPCRATTW